VKYCPKCGTPSIDDQSVFCIKCGTTYPPNTPIINPQPDSIKSTGSKERESGVTCLICGSNTPEGRFCEHCGAQLVAPYPQYNLPVSHEPTSFPEPYNTIRPFYYSNIFYIVIILDLVISGFCGAIVIGQLLFPGHSPTSNLGLSIYFGGVWLINLIMDLFILTNMWKSPNTIDSNSCWIKCVFGFIGLITFISGLYFLIISIKMQRAHNLYQR